VGSVALFWVFVGLVVFVRGEVIFVLMVCEELFGWGLGWLERCGFLHVVHSIVLGILLVCSLVFHYS